MFEFQNYNVTQYSALYMYTVIHEKSTKPCYDTEKTVRL